MVIDKRIHQILETIVHNPSITGIELEDQFGLTRKQLSYAFQKVNDFLESSQLEPIKRYKTGKFSVSKLVIDTFKKSDNSISVSRYVYSEEERTSIIIFYLLIRTEKLSLLHLSSALQVSQNTIINDIKKVQKIIENHSLQVNYDRENGYRILGSEIHKRYLLLDIIRKIMAIPAARKIFFENNEITATRIELVGDVFSKIEKKLKILFTDEQLQELTYFVSLVLHRIETGKIIKELPENYIQTGNSRDFQLMKKLIETLGIYDLNEQIFLTIIIQSSNIQTIEDKYFHLDAMLLESVVEVIDNFEQISCITFKDKSELIERIYQHWKPAYYRIRYDIANINSVYDVVLQEFGHLHEIVRRSIEPFENLLCCKMPDEEVSFITMLFGGWLTREGMINQVKTKKIAVVVCESSATVSTYLYLTLQVLLPELHFSDAMSKREFEKYSRYYDIVFSTSHLATNKILFVVNPSLNNFHKNAFRKQVIGVLQGLDPSIIQLENILFIIEKYTHVNDKKALQKELAEYLYKDNSKDNALRISESSTPSLAELISVDHINMSETAYVLWDKAIEMASKPLLEKGLIEASYIDRMINKIRQEQPYIMLVDGLIIAHAGIDDGANQVCMSLLKLPERIDIAGYMQADLIIVLATNNPQKHLKALAQLNEFLEFHHGASRIRSASHNDEIYSLFSHYQ